MLYSSGGGTETRQSHEKNSVDALRELLPAKRFTLEIVKGSRFVLILWSFTAVCPHLSVILSVSVCLSVLSLLSLLTHTADLQHPPALTVTPVCSTLITSVSCPVSHILHCVTLSLQL